MSPSTIADRLMQMAARRSVQTQFGWTHPDCEALQEAARMLISFEQQAQDRVGAVLSAGTWRPQPPPSRND